MSIDNEERKNGALKRCARMAMQCIAWLSRAVEIRPTPRISSRQRSLGSMLHLFRLAIPNTKKRGCYAYASMRAKTFKRAHGARRYPQCPMSSMLPTRAREKRQRRKKRRSMKPCKGCRLNSAQWFICIISRAFRPGRQRKCSACVRRRCAAICIEHVSP